MLHRAQFSPYPGSHMPAIQMATFIRQCNLERNNIVSVQEQEDGTLILFYWQDLHR